jgi:hypothetical protein
MVIRGRTCLVGVRYSLTMLCRIAGTDKAMIMLVEPREYQWLQVQMRLVVASRVQA